MDSTAFKNLLIPIMSFLPQVDRIRFSHVCRAFREEYIKFKKLQSFCPVAALPIYTYLKIKKCAKRHHVVCIRELHEINTAKREDYAARGACAGGHISLMRAMKPDELVKTVYHAAKHGHMNAVIYILKLPMKKTIKDEVFRAILAGAIWGSPDTPKSKCMEIFNRFKSKCRENPRTYMYNACARSNKEVIQILSNDPKIAFRNQMLETGIYGAYFSGNHKLIEMLPKYTDCTFHGAFVNACRSGHIELVLGLLKNIPSNINTHSEYAQGLEAGVQHKKLTLYACFSIWARMSIIIHSTRRYTAEISSALCY